MVRAGLLVGLVFAGGSALAAPVAPAVPPAAAAADVEALQLRLLSAQQVIATLERQLADERNRAAALEQARLRNGHLVSIARQLIDSYAKRYGIARRHDPIQLGRRRFEFELQALSAAIYDMDADVPLRNLPGGAAVALPSSGSAAPDPAPEATGAKPQVGAVAPPSATDAAKATGARPAVPDKRP